MSGAVMTDSVELVLREDGVAQEGDETFTLTLVSTTSSLFEANFFLVDELSVTIIDADGEWKLQNNGIIWQNECSQVKL